MRFRVHEIFFGVFLTVAVFAVGYSVALFPSYPIENGSGDGSTAQPQGQENPLSAFWHWTSHDPVAFYTAVLTVFTFVLGVSSFFLWWETKKAGALARDEFNATHRAKVRVLYVRADTDPDAPVALVLTYVNIGDIEAKIDVFAHEFIIVPCADTDTGILKMNTHAIGATIESGVPQTARIVSARLGDDMAQIAVKQGGFAAEFQCVGYVQYSDVSGAERRTGFCFKLNTDGMWTPVPHSDYAYEY